MVANLGKSIDNRAVPIIDGTVTHTAVNVTTSSVEHIAANDARRGLILINDSDTAIYIKFGATAVANQGIRINANGGSLELNEKSGPHYVGAIQAIHGGTGNKVLLITEW